MLEIRHPHATGPLGPEVHWVFVDRDTVTAEELAQTSDQRLVPAISSRQLQTVAAELRTKFLQWADRQMSTQPAEEWLKTRLYPNPYLDDLFLHCCWLELIARWEPSTDRPLVVVTASDGFARAAARLCRRRGWGFRWPGRGKFARQRGWFLLRGLGGFGKHMFEHAARWCLVRVLLGAKYRDRLRRVHTLVSSYVHAQDISPVGGYRDRYFKGMVDYFESEGFLPAVMPRYADISLTQFPVFLRRLKRSARLFAAPELFMQPVDLLIAGWRCLRSSRSGGGEFQGLEIGELVASTQQATAMKRFSAVLLHLSLARAAAHGLQPVNVILWHENQPEDKAIVLALRRTQPQSQVIGVKPFVPIPNMMSQFNTSGQVEQGVAPRVTWVGGADQVSCFSMHDRLGQYYVVPALRYAHLHATASGNGADGSEFAILLTFSAEESRAILRLAASALPVLRRCFGGIVVKPHPDLADESFRSEVTALFGGVDGYKWLTEGMDGALGRARAVLTAGTSSAVEALGRGLPVMIAGVAAGLEMNPLEWFDPRLWCVVDTPASLERVAHDWSPSHPLPVEERRRIGGGIREKFFLRADPETLRRYISPEFGFHARLAQ